MENQEKKPCVFSRLANSQRKGARRTSIHFSNFDIRITYYLRKKENKKIAESESGRGHCSRLHVWNPDVFKGCGHRQSGTRHQPTALHKGGSKEGGGGKEVGGGGGGAVISRPFDLDITRNLE